MKDYLDLVRAPAALTVLGDTIAGGLAAGHVLRPRRLALSVASACLYAGGMALNDYADRELDAVERPERPIPSGRVSPAAALGTAGGLTAVGLAIAGAAGGRATLIVAVPLAAAIWTYDLVAKPTVLGPLTMSACRGLDVLMGAGAGRLRPALPAAAVIAAHTAGVTLLSRGEVTGSTPATAAAVGGISAIGAVTAVAGSGTGAGAVVSGVAAVKYLLSCLPHQLRAVRSPAAEQVRTATRAGITAMVPLQATLAARAGSVPAAGGLLALDGLNHLLARRRRSGGRKADIT